MRFEDIFFRIEGRLDRRAYWIWSSVVSVMVLLHSIPFFEEPESGFDVNYLADGLTLLVTALAGSWFAVAIWAKRMHDIGKSAHWFWPYAGGFLLFVVGSEYYYLVGSRELAVVFDLLEAALYLWIVVEAGFFRGQPGANRFGPDPREGGIVAGLTTRPG